ncbi:biotin-dependent carboxyltransferase family protein [Chitinophagaceae bacterium LWZ2-11]
MSIKIIKAGVLDTIQDLGRFGYAHLGINPSGVMDTCAASVANILTGNNITEGIIELHFPSAELLFQQDALIALSGSDFNATINNVGVPLNVPIIIKQAGVLRFTKKQTGARCYLSIRGGFDLPFWLNSLSTNTKAQAGGYKGRRLLKDDVIPFRNKIDYTKALRDHDFQTLPWKGYFTDFYYSSNLIRFTGGPEYTRLNTISQTLLTTTGFNITTQSDKMGYCLKGEELSLTDSSQLLSSTVTTGAIQLLPNGQLIILMADHQTTGGYPRIGNVVYEDIAKLAQMNPNQTIQFQKIALEEAETLLYKHRQYLQQLQNACNFRLQEYLHQNELY